MRCSLLFLYFLCQVGGVAGALRRVPWELSWWFLFFCEIRIQAPGRVRVGGGLGVEAEKDEGARPCTGGRGRAWGVSLDWGSTQGSQGRVQHDPVHVLCCFLLPPSLCLWSYVSCGALSYVSVRSLGTSALSDVFLTQDRPQSPPTVGLSKSSNVVVAGMGLALGFDYKASPVSGLRSGSSLPFVIQSPFLPEEREERAGTPGKKFN